jgi:hypothetical protein
MDWIAAAVRRNRRSLLLIALGSLCLLLHGVVFAQLDTGVPMSSFVLCAVSASQAVRLSVRAAAAVPELRVGTGRPGLLINSVRVSVVLRAG